MRRGDLTRLLRLWIVLLAAVLATGGPISKQRLRDLVAGDRDDGEERDGRDERGERTCGEERDAKDVPRTVSYALERTATAVAFVPPIEHGCVRSVAPPRHPARLSMRRLI